MDWVAKVVTLDIAPIVQVMGSTTFSVIIVNMGFTPVHDEADSFNIANH
jgi:hypothetical protein